MDFNSEAPLIPDEGTFSLLLQQLRMKVNALGLDFGVTARTDEPFLSKFLRTKNYIVEEALKSVKRYYANVKRNLEFIDGIRPSDFHDTFKSGPFIIFKNRSEGRRIGAFQMALWKPKVTTLKEVQLTAVLLAEHMLTEVETQQKGVIVIFDLKGLSFEHIRYLTPRELKRVLLTGQEGLPIKISEVHIINPPPFYWSLHHISMRFVKDKIRKRIHLHYSNETLHEFIDPAICPGSLGGHLSEHEAKDNDLVHGILHSNLPYENLYSGTKIPKNKRKLSRKRSSNGDILLGMADKISTLAN